MIERLKYFLKNPRNRLIVLSTLAVVTLLVILVGLSISNRAATDVTPTPEASKPIIWVTVREEVDGKLVAGEGSLLIDGDVEDIEPLQLPEGRKAVPIVGGKFFHLKQSEGEDRYGRVKPLSTSPASYQITTLVYKSFLTNKTHFLPPTGVANSLSPLVLEGNAKINITIRPDSTQIEIER